MDVSISTGSSTPRIDLSTLVACAVRRFRIAGQRKYKRWAELGRLMARQQDPLRVRWSSQKCYTSQQGNSSRFAPAEINFVTPKNVHRT